MASVASRPWALVVASRLAVVDLPATAAYSLEPGQPLARLHLAFSVPPSHSREVREY